MRLGPHSPAERGWWGGEGGEGVLSRSLPEKNKKDLIQPSPRLSANNSGSADTPPFTPWPTGPATFSTTHCHHFTGDHAALRRSCTQIPTQTREKREKDASTLLSTPLLDPDVQPDLPTNSSASAALALRLPAWSGRQQKASTPAPSH